MNIDMIKFYQTMGYFDEKEPIGPTRRERLTNLIQGIIEHRDIYELLIEHKNCGDHETLHLDEIQYIRDYLTCDVAPYVEELFGKY